MRWVFADDERGHMHAPTQTRTCTPPFHKRRTEPTALRVTEKTDTEVTPLDLTHTYCVMAGSNVFGPPSGNPVSSQGELDQTAKDGVAATLPCSRGSGGPLCSPQPSLRPRCAVRLCFLLGWFAAPLDRLLKLLLLLPTMAPRRGKGAPFHNSPNRSRRESFPLVLAAPLAVPLER